MGQKSIYCKIKRQEKYIPAQPKIMALKYLTNQDFEENSHLATGIE